MSNWYNDHTMTTKQRIQTNKSLIQAFERYKVRYLLLGKKPDVMKLLPADLYSTMRLEGEAITKIEAQALYR